jgi:hypothetical protein
MKRKTDDETTQTAIRLPTDLYQRLKRAGGERGMAEQIRNRLEASFEAEKAPADAKTRELLDAIAFVADETATYCGHWSDKVFAFEVLAECIDLLLKMHRPTGEARPTFTDFGELFFASNSSSEDISRSFVGDWRRAKAKREERKR